MFNLHFTQEASEALRGQADYYSVIQIVSTQLGLKLSAVSLSLDHLMPNPLSAEAGKNVYECAAKQHGLCLTHVHVPCSYEFRVPHTAFLVVPEVSKYSVGFKVQCGTEMAGCLSQNQLSSPS